MDDTIVNCILDDTQARIDASAPITDRDLNEATRMIRSHNPETGHQAVSAYMNSDGAMELMKSSVADKVKSVRDARTCMPKLKIHAKLDRERLEELTQVACEFDLEMTETDCREHCFARAATTVMAGLLDKDVLELHNLREPENPEAFKVRHIGENPIKLINAGNLREHNCLPYTKAGDSRDVARYGKLRSTLLNRDFSRDSASVQYLSNCYKTRFIKDREAPNVCCNLAQNCDVKALTLRARNIHDISPTQVATAMAKSGATVAGGIIMYSPGIFFADVQHGLLPFTQYTFTRRTNRSTNREEIVFAGPGDSQDPYVHSWNTYSSWIKGDRRLLVKLDGKRFHFEFSIHLAALDHLIWKMYPVTTRCAQSSLRTLPMMSNSRVATVCGYWFDSENPAYGLLYKPSKRAMLVPRIAHIPKYTHDLVSALLGGQTNTFTPSYTYKCLNNYLSTSVGDSTLKDVYNVSPSDIHFLSDCIYSTQFDLRYMSTQTASIVNDKITDFRGRWDHFWLRRLVRKWKSNPDSSDLFQFKDEHGRLRGTSRARVSRMLTFFNAHFDKSRKCNTIDLKPLILSATSSFTFTDTSTVDFFALEASFAAFRKALAHVERHFSSGPSAGPRIMPFKTRLVREGIDLRDMACDKHGVNTCLIDAFIAAARESLVETCGFAAVVSRIVRSGSLLDLPNADELVTALELDKPLPLTTLFILAEEYGVRIVVSDGGRATQYGENGPVLYMRYSDEHLVPCYRFQNSFPSFVPLIPKLDYVITPVTEHIATQVSYMNFRDTEKAMLYGKYYDDVYLLDRVFCNSERKRVFNPTGDMAACVPVRRVFNWVWHTAAHGVAHDVKTYSGVSKPLAIKDELFWDNAVSDTQFRFDAIMFDAREDTSSLTYLERSVKLLNATGVCAILMSACSLDVLYSTIIPIMHDKFESVAIYCNSNSSLLSCTFIMVFRGYLKGTCDITRELVNTFDNIAKYNYYLTQALEECGGSVQATCTSVARHIIDTMPFVELQSFCDNLERDAYDYVAHPLADVLLEDAAVGESILKVRNRRSFIDRFRSVARTCGNGIRSFFMEQLDISGDPYDIAVYDHDSLPAVEGSLKSQLEQLKSMPELVYMKESRDAAAADEFGEQDPGIVYETVNRSSSEPHASIEVAADVESETCAVPDVNYISDDTSAATAGQCVPSTATAPSVSNNDIPANCAAHLASGSVTVVDFECESGPIARIIPPKRTAASYAEKSDYIRSISEFVQYHVNSMVIIPKLCEDTATYYLSTRSNKKLGTTRVRCSVEASEKDYIILERVKNSTTLFHSIVPNNTMISNDYTHVWDIDQKVLYTTADFKEKGGRRGLVIPDLDPLVSDKYAEIYNPPDRHIRDYKLEITTVQAVAGAGKTSRMIENYKVGDMIVVPTCTARDDVLRRLVKTHDVFARFRAIYDSDLKDSEKDNLMRQLKRYNAVRTMCSLLLNRVSVETLWIDEMTLHHRGAIYLAAFVTGAKKIVCMGDAAQTYCFSRHSVSDFMFHKIDEKIKPSEYLTKTNRCARKIAMLAQGFYYSSRVLGEGKKFETTRKKVGYVCVRKYDLQEIVLRIQDARKHDVPVAVITFTRADKSKLRRDLKSAKCGGIDIPVHTITEFQGSEAVTVILVRTNTNNKATGLYSSTEQILTAITRARDNFLYFTLAMNDPLSNAIKNLHKEGL